ncbi:hypothetical protein WJX72_000669 [[Myrmecia] bisecta]|uniref:DNA-directed DNA polymerase family A palm domain-containing protein n=1 Tax=[Myrmecia] bisecta TaxID=41462 RepID=A0AAW1P9V6_9CHLO
MLRRLLLRGVRERRQPRSIGGFSVLGSWPSMSTAEPMLHEPPTSDSSLDAVISSPAVTEASAEDDSAADTLSSDSDSSVSSSSSSNGALPAARDASEPSLVPNDVFVVESVEEAERVCDMLCAMPPNTFFACDTEVSNIDVTKESAVGHGTVTCFSVYCGPDVHFGGQLAAGGVTQNQLWVDTLLDGKQPAKAAAIAAVFKRFFEDESLKKVWHNYGFDRHVLANAPTSISCRGFGGDTMHLARLWDASRARFTGTGYSLESLTSDKELMGAEMVDPRSKVSMKKIFGRAKLKKDGTPGKVIELPAIEVLQTDAMVRGDWINYSAYDAKATWELHQALVGKLGAMPCVMDRDVDRTKTAKVDGSAYTMLDMYHEYWRPFGELLTDMEKSGMMVDREHLRAAEKKALADQAEARERFTTWAAAKVPDAAHMNICSGPQIRQLLFPGVPNGKDPKKGSVEMERQFKIPNVGGFIEDGKKAAKKTRDITLWGVWGRNVPPRVKPELFTPAGWPASSGPVLRMLAGKPGAAKRKLLEMDGVDTSQASAEEVPLEALMEDDALPTDSLDADAAQDGAEEGAALISIPLDQQAKAKAKGKAKAEAEEPGEKHAEEWPVTEADIIKQNGAEEVRLEDLQAEASANGYGQLYAAFGGARAGLEACAAVDALCEYGAIDTLLSTFIVPLQGDQIATRDERGNHRIHCSLNINTETGRLSARRPNLQNQPALEKDRYKVRKAFTADAAAGKTLIVADYGQLELRLLAHMAGCRSMLDAFKAGGDFHSRTALGMYDHIQDAIKQGKCLLEWDGEHEGAPPPVPLLKDMFGSERRKAKVLNFSIAYGKTAHGLSKDWKVTVEEAQATVDRWYADRPEVLAWQKRQQHQATSLGYVTTLLGRRRQLPDAMQTGRGKGAARSHALRAAINTPIQGSAADVAAAAMVSIAMNEQLRKMGWVMLLQVHDEVIMEGPKETAEEAQQILINCMQQPFSGVNPLSVELLVDSNIADTWYEAK